MSWTDYEPFISTNRHTVPSIPFFKIPSTKGKYTVKHLADEYTGHSQSLSLTENE